jgi:hypothetical protein
MEYTLDKTGKGWPHHVVLDQAMIDKIMVNGNKRAIAKVEGSNKTFHCGILKKKELGYYVYINTDVVNELKLTIGSKLRLHLEIDTSENQFATSPELNEVLDQDPEAKAIFNKLTAGKQRSLIYLVLSVKSIDKRIERALKIAQKIKIGITSAMEIMK